MRNIHELKCFLFVQVLRKLNAKIKMSKPICPARSSPPLSLISMLAKQGARTNFRPNSEEPLHSRMPWRDLSPLQLASGIFSSRPHICQQHSIQCDLFESLLTTFFQKLSKRSGKTAGILAFGTFSLRFSRFSSFTSNKMVANIRKQDEAKRPKQNTFQIFQRLFLPLCLTLWGSLDHSSADI